MARLNYTVQEINAALAKAIAAANTGTLADLNTTDKSSLVAAINESLTLAGLPSQTDNANKFLMTDGTSPSWENLGDFVSISGAIASFKRRRAGARLYPKIFFNPVQAGSGDPSPSNVRAISGWSQVTPSRTGKNLLDASKLKDQSGWNSFTIELPPNTPIIASSNMPSSKTSELPLYVYGTGTPGAGTLVYSGHPVTIANAGGTIHVQQRRVSGTDSFANYEWQIELGSTASPYEPYNGSTYPISLGNTYYGGYVDLTRGKIVVDHLYFKGGWTQYNSSNGFKAYNHPTLGSASKYASGGAISNMINSWGSFSSSSMSENKIQLPTNNTAVFYMALDENANADDVEVCYTLATPLEYDLAEIPNIISLLGINNVFADSGDVEVTIPCDVASLDGNAKILPSQKTATIKEYSSAHTINKDDYSCLLLVTGATTITLPTCDIGTEIEIMRYGTSTVTIAPSGVTINGSSSNQTITTRYQSMKLKCISATAWVMT